MSSNLFVLSAEFSELLFFLFRKIGKTVAFEKDRVRVFQLWCSQILQFPSMDYDLRPQILYDCYRQWVVSRGGFRTPFLDEVEEVSTNMEY